MNVRKIYQMKNKSEHAVCWNFELGSQKTLYEIGHFID